MASGGLELPRIIFPDHIVQHCQRCDDCLNYLTVGPVVLTADKLIFCGRCSDSFKEQVTMTKSLFNIIAEESKFKCINHYEGCNAILGFDETRKHETNCRGKDYECLFCSYRATNGSQLVFHYESCHLEKVVRKNSFKIPPACEDQETELIFYDHSHILMFSIFFKEDQLKISASYITDYSESLVCSIRFEENNVSLLFVINLTGSGKGRKYLDVPIGKLNQHFPGLSNVVSKVEMGSRKPPERKFEEELLRIRKNFVELRDKYREDFVVQLLKETCNMQENNIKLFEESNEGGLGNLATTGIMIPKKDNALLKRKYLLYGENILECAECGQFKKYGNIFFYLDGNQLCDRCFVSKGLWWAEIDCLESTYTCPCAMVETFWNYHEHKRKCILRTYKCVVDSCKDSFNFDDMVKHWHSDHPLKCGKCMELDRAKNHTFYWLPDYELFFIQISWSKESNYVGRVQVKGIDVSTYYHGVAVFEYEKSDYNCNMKVRSPNVIPYLPFNYTILNPISNINFTYVQKHY